MVPRVFEPGVTIFGILMVSYGVSLEHYGNPCLVGVGSLFLLSFSVDGWIRPFCFLSLPPFSSCPGIKSNFVRLQGHNTHIAAVLLPFL